MTTLGHRLALVELAELRADLARMLDRLAAVEVALGAGVVDLRDRPQKTKNAPTRLP